MSITRTFRKISAIVAGALVMLELTGIGVPANAVVNSAQSTESVVASSPAGATPAVIPEASGLVSRLAGTASAGLGPAQGTAAARAPAGKGKSVPTLSYRPGARWGQIDILMDDYETAMVAKSLWGGNVVCWPAAVAGYAGGPAGSFGAFVSCISIATVCAARAYLSKPRMRTGITMTIWGYGWCWKY